MIPRRILKYVAAYRRTEEVALDEHRARSDDVSYQMDIAHDCEMLAHERSRLEMIGYKGLAMSLMNAFYASLAGAAIGSATAFIRGDDSSTTLLEVIGGDLGGAALGLSVSLGLWRLNEKRASIVSLVRNTRIEKRGPKVISEHQRKNAHKALADSEFSKMR